MIVVGEAMVYINEQEEITSQECIRWIPIKRKQSFFWNCMETYTAEEYTQVIFKDVSGCTQRTTSP